jgi:hypothetical protein
LSILFPAAFLSCSSTSLSNIEDWNLSLHAGHCQYVWNFHIFLDPVQICMLCICSMLRKKIHISRIVIEVSWLDIVSMSGVMAIVFGSDNWMICFNGLN